MPNVSRTIEVAAAPETVWSKIVDFSSHEQWMETHVAFPDGVPATVAPDTSFREKVTIMGMPGEVAWTITEVVDGQVLRMEGKGPMGTFLKSGFELAAESGGTKLTLDNEFGGAALGPLVGALTKETEKALAASLAKLQVLLTPPAGPA